jgi:uncharacterized membrane protein YccC
VSPIDFFRRELAPSHRRFVEAARNATKTSITTGLAATMQILGPFGPLFAFRIGQPGISLGLFEGVITIAFAAAMQAAIVPITGKLLDYPGLIMAFLFLVFATMGYLLSNTRLFLILALVAVGTITTVYVGIFEPGQIGWGSTYTFDGILVATLVMVVIDTLIWPSSPEPRLLESIATDLEHTRGRLKLVGQRYLDPIAAPLAAPQVASMLARNLALLKPVKEQTKPAPRHLAALIEAVMTAEHAYLEVERLAVLVDESPSDELTRNHREEIELALKALDRALAERAEDILAGVRGGRDSEEWVSEMRVATKHLSQFTTQALPANDQFTPSGRSNFLRFVGGLEAIGNLLHSRERPTSADPAEGTSIEANPEPRPLFDPVAFRFSIKLGVAITLGLIVGLTTQRADLQTILWSTVVAGQPNQYGAVIRKTLLRLAGCILGGLAALAAMILVSENFDSLPPYLIAIFAVAMFSTYVSQSSEWLGYAGIQAGITFLICYVGLAPTSDVYKPLWRFWGILLGVLTTGFVFLVLWPEYASDKVIESLSKLMRTTLTFGEEVAEGRITEEQISAVEQRLSANLLEVLNMADQARLEGQRGATNSPAAIEAASSIVRIAYRFEVIARGRIAESPVPQHQQLLEHQAMFEKACCAALEIQLAKLERTDSPEHLAQSSAAPTIDLAPMSENLVSVQSTHLPTEKQILLATQFESYRRLPILLMNLDTSLSRITDSPADR